jgi:hypothetical protein
LKRNCAKPVRSVGIQDGLLQRSRAAGACV